MRLEEAVVEQNIRKKEKIECFTWDFFKRYIAKNDGEDQVLDIFALAIYGLVIFPKVPGHVEVAVIDVIEQIESQANPVLAIVAETLRTLNFCRRSGKGDYFMISRKRDSVEILARSSISPESRAKVDFKVTASR